MIRFINNLYSEFIKLFCTKVFKIVFLLIIVAQSLISYISARQILAVGIDAVPTATNGLLEPMPAIEYMGFDTIMFATIPMIVLGAVLGALEFKQHNLRTTILCFGKKKNIFISKTIAVTIISFLISLISTILSISITHMTLGTQGLTPLVFNHIVWKFILLATISLTLLTLLSYAIGFLCRTEIFPLLFLIIQQYNLGNILAEKFEVCRYLPVSLSNEMIASSESILLKTPVQNIIGLLIWIFFFLITGYVLFRKLDLQGEY